MQVTSDMIKNMVPGTAAVFTGAMDKRYVQRIRNYCQKAKTDLKGYRVRTVGDEVTVSCVSEVTPNGLTAQLQAMKSGEVIHPCDYRKQSVVAGTVAALGGGYKVRLVVEVVKE